MGSVPDKLDTYEVDDSFVRPDNVTAYAAGDAVADLSAATSATTLVFANIAASNGGSVRIHQVNVLASALGTGTPVLELWLFDAPPTLQADNSAYTLVSANDVSKLLTVIPIYQAFTATNLGLYSSNELSRDIKVGANTTNIWGQLKTLNAYTPTALEEYTIQISGIILS